MGTNDLEMPFSTLACERDTQEFEDSNSTKRPFFATVKPNFELSSQKDTYFEFYKATKLWGTGFS